MSALQRAVHCITGEVLRAAGFRPAAPLLTLTLARGETVPLTGGAVPLSFRMRHRYRLVEDRDVPARRRWHVLVVDYAYVFARRDTDREMLAFHWHPHIANKPFPHVHLESGLGLEPDLTGIHVPIGLLAVEDIVRFAIEELGVRPRLRNWDAVLERTGAEVRDGG